MSLTYKEVAEIVKLIKASTLEEIVLELGPTRLAIRRNTSGAGQVAVPPAAAGSRLVVASTAATDATVTAPVAPTDGNIATASIKGDIRAPMVGSFYRRPSPSEAPFVEIGSRVSADDPVCLIEVMKLFNTIAAPCDGIVEAILPADTSLVAFDQLLIRIRAD